MARELSGFADTDARKKMESWPVHYYSKINTILDRVTPGFGIAEAGLLMGLGEREAPPGCGKPRGLAMVDEYCV